MDHPLRTLLYELFIKPVLRVAQQVFRTRELQDETHKKVREVWR